MPAQRKWQPHGTRERYRQGGCDDLVGGSPGAGDRCADCIEAMADYNARKKAGEIVSKGHNVTSIDKHRTSKAAGKPSSTKKKPAMGEYEEAIRSQLEAYTESDPGYVAMAVAGARILDNPEAWRMHPQAIQRIQSVTDKLGQSKRKKSRGRLAAVQAITR